MAARVGFEPTEVALGRFQGGCTRPLCDLANRALPGGHILAMIRRYYPPSRATAGYEACTWPLMCALVLRRCPEHSR